MATLSGIDGPARKGIGQMLKENRLQVPFYQRAYAWKKSHVSDLYADLGRALDEGGKQYFLGSIVAIQNNGGSVEIVDGQQRLATTAILIAAMRDHLLQLKETEPATDIERDYLIRKYGIRERREEPSLVLNETDNDYFRKRILSRPGTLDRGSKALRESHTRIDEAAQLAKDHVQNVTAGRKPSDQLTVLDNWLKFVEQHAQVILIKVSDPADAFVIFETLNDRGLELSIADLTKNYLFGRSGKRVEEAKHNWNRMIGTLQAVSETDISKFYIHQLWSSVHGITRDREVFAKIREKIRGEQTAIDFSTQLADDAILYAALRNADHEYWQEWGPNVRRNIHILNSHLRVTQIRMLFLPMLEKFSKAEVKKVLPVAVCWSVRFLIAGGSPGNLERYYSSHAVKIRRGEIKDAAELIRSMATVVPNDERFKVSFASETVSADYLARYYLQCLERGLLKVPNPYLAEDDETIGSLEHILPKNRDASVWNISDDVADRLVRRIGNMALLTPKDNSNRGNDSFKAAKKYYAKSDFRLTKALAALGDEWDEEAIKKRQEYLAELAVKAWPIPT